MSAEEPFAPESSRRRRDPARTAGRLSARTTLAAARATRAFLVATAAVSAGAQSLSAQGGMYYPYGSAVGPLYGYARRPRRVARARREPSSRPTRACSFAPLTRSSWKKNAKRQRLSSRASSSGPIVGVGPFGGVAPIGYTSGVSFGGAPRFFPGGFGGVGAVRGAVYRREVRRGLRATRDATTNARDATNANDERRTKARSNSTAEFSLNCSETKQKTLWDIVRAEPELSALRALLANDVPWVAATLDAKKLADDADPLTAFPNGAPYDPDAPGLVPLLDERTGAFHVDTLFAPNDNAVEALRTYLLGGGGDAEADSPSPSASNRSEPPSALEMLGAGNATAATLFVAYHVSPDVRLRLPELRRGELLRTALGGAARLMVDRVEDAADDFSHGYDDGPGGEAVVRGVGSQAGVLGGGVDACNGRVFVVDRVLLPVDVDGVTTPEQKAHADAIRRAVEAEARTVAEAPAAAETGN